MPPLLFFLKDSINVTRSYFVLQIIRDPALANSNFFTNSTVLDTESGIEDALFIMAHWVFGVQYLRTSLVLPILFKTAKIEWLL